MKVAATTYELSVNDLKELLAKELKVAPSRITITFHQTDANERYISTFKAVTGLSVRVAAEPDSSEDTLGM